MELNDNLSKFNGGMRNEVADAYLSFKDYNPESDIMPKLTREQISYIGTCLNDYHAIFYTFWSLGNISFSKSVQTASVVFEQDGSGRVVNFIFNPDYWQSLRHYDRIFIICHECLHIVFKHGKRMRTLQNYDKIDKNKEVLTILNHKIINCAMDLAVNHTLVNRFGFIQKHIKGWNQLCWVETIFPGGDISNKKYSEYYIGKLKENSKKFNITKLLNGVRTADCHDKYGNKEGTEQDDMDKEERELLKKINKLLGNDEKKDIQDILNESNKEACCEDKDGENDKTEKVQEHNPGYGKGDKIWTFDTNIKVPKKNWKTLIKKAYLVNKHVWSDDDQWIRPARRNALLDASLMLPSCNDTYDSKERNKVNAWVFLDVSGSCEAFVPRFWDLTKTIPNKLFNTRLFSFDTQTHEIFNGKIEGGGGTSFHIIEDMIQSYMVKEYVKYPHVVIVITDGYGDDVIPKYPERWHWIIPRGGKTNLINNKSIIYKLEDFE